jgi:hypothetical protein
MSHIGFFVGFFNFFRVTAFLGGHSSGYIHCKNHLSVPKIRKTTDRSNIMRVTCIPKLPQLPNLTWSESMWRFESVGWWVLRGACACCAAGAQGHGCEMTL